MRSLLLLLVCLGPLGARAASVLVVPADERSRPYAEELIEAFSAAGVTVKLAGPTSPGVRCMEGRATRNACLADLEEKAKVDGIVVMSAVAKGGKVAVTFELLSGGEVLKRDGSRGTKGKLAATLRPLVASAMKTLKKSVGAPVETPPEKPPEPVMTVTTRPIDTKPADAPTTEEPKPELTPKKTALDDELTLREAPPPAPKVKVAAWVVTGLAVAAAGAAATLGGIGAAGASRVNTVEGNVSPLSYTEAVALQEASNAQLSAALGLGIGAGLAGTVAGLLWALE